MNLATLATVTTSKSPATNQRAIVDAEFTVVSGGLRVGDEHPTEKGWYFTGRTDDAGHPVFMRSAAWFQARRRKRFLIGLAILASGPLILLAIELARYLDSPLR